MDIGSTLDVYTSKVCTKCNTLKFLDHFPWSCGRRHSQCKVCRRQIKRRWDQNNTSHKKKYKKYWDDLNKVHNRQYRAQYYVNNKKKENARATYLYNNDVKYKIAHNLRNRLRDAIKNNYKSGSAVKDLGCTISKLKKHLESQFKLNMSWDNWKHDGWHIDHVKPLSKFDLADRKQLLEAVHYTNLQPLWAKENMSKGSKY